MKWWNHFKTITHHKKLVMQHCFRVGLYYQGLTHDLSKYSPVEFLPGVRFYQGDRSPNDAERKTKGYSAAWLHHKGRNKHHLEYWVDYSAEGDHRLGRASVCRKNMWRKCSATAWQPARPIEGRSIRIVTHIPITSILNRLI